MKRILILATLLASLTFLWRPTANAQSPFYEGSILIDSIQLQIDIKQDAQVEAEYVLVNTSKEIVQVSLNHDNSNTSLAQGELALEDPVAFGPGEVITISLTSNLMIEGDVSKSITFDPNLLFDSMRHGQVVNTYSIKVLLPPGVQRLISEFQVGATRENNPDDRILYTWEYFSLYPTTFHVIWSELGADLRVQKQIEPLNITEPDQELHVTLSLMNDGDETVTGINLMDDLDPAEYEPIEPLDDFTLVSDADSDPRLYWQADLETLAPGETRTFEYAVRYIGDVSMIHGMWIKPCVARVDGHMVATSNPVHMNKLVGAVKVDTDGETPLAEMTPESIEPPEDVPPPLWIPIIITIGGVIGIVLIGVGLNMVRRRRSVR